MNTVTVVIPAYNESRTIAETIRSIQSQTRPPERIIVVDDCSSDGTGEIARRLGAKVIRARKNQGTKAQAQNLAIPFVRTDLTVSIDADTTLAPDALENMVNAFERDPKLVVASGYVLPRHQNTVWERGRLVEYLYGFEVYRMAQRDVGAPIVCSGCFLAFRTEVLKHYGGFELGTITEDINFTWKVLTSGGKATFVPEAICYPVDPPTWSVYYKQVDRWSRGFFQNLLIFWKKLHRKPLLALFIWISIVEGLVFPFSLLAMLYVIVQGMSGGIDFNWKLWLGTLVGFEFLMVTIFSILGAIRVRCLSKALPSIPCYFVLRAVNIGLWWRAFWLEVIKKEKLKAWQKGH